MAYAFYLDVPADDALYAEIRAELPQEGPAGLLLHLVTPCDHGAAAEPGRRELLQIGRAHV
jgi:hypothetical protein